MTESEPKKQAIREREADRIRKKRAAARIAERAQAQLNLREWLVNELLKLDGKCLDEMADVQSVAEALACALEARAQKKET